METNKQKQLEEGKQRRFIALQKNTMHLEENKQFVKTTTTTTKRKSDVVDPIAGVGVWDSLQ